MNLPDIHLDKIRDLEEAKAVIRELLNGLEQCVKSVNQQVKEIEQLRGEINRLKGQPKKPQFATHKKQGKQISVTSLLKEKRSWHKSKKGKLPIDKDEQLPEVEHCVCGSEQFRILRTFVKVMQGLLIIRNNIAYHGRKKQCVDCGRTYKSIIPEEIRGLSFDTNLRSLLSYLKFACRMTQPLILRMLTGFGIQISSGEIDRILLQNGDGLKSVQKHLRTEGFKKSAHLQSDASGSKRRDKRTGKVLDQYVQVISNTFLSVFTITRRYNAKTLNKLLGSSGKKKPYISDDGSPNGELLRNKIKQLCLVHEIRLFKKLFPFFNQHRNLQKQILTQWSNFYHAAKQYGRDPTEEKKKQIENLFDKLVTQETGYKELDKQLRLSAKKRDRLLTFLDYPELPIHNNQCEHDIREFVLIRKITGGTKSIKGDRSLERHLSVIQTAQKQGLNVFQTLHGLLTGKLPPSILTANIA